jgi:hypothetical protein
MKALEDSFPRVISIHIYDKFYPDLVLYGRLEDQLLK